MMKKKLFIFLFILFILASIFIVAALLSGAYSYYQSAKLIEAIQHNKTSKALDIIDNMDNVNSYNTPFFCIEYVGY